MRHQRFQWLAKTPEGNKAPSLLCLAELFCRSCQNGLAPCNVVGQRVQAPAHGHNPLEIMTQQDYTQHWITPPPELVSKWTRNRGYSCSSELWDYLATQAAQWGADQELESILEMVGFGQQSLPEEDRYLDGFTVASIRAARRPKPPSLKQQALGALAALEINELGYEGTYDTIRRALEQLPDAL